MRPARPAVIDADPAIRLEAVHKRYAVGSGEVHALRGLDLEIGRGEYVSVMGPSGSGKSTLLEILGCLSRPSAGRYWLHGVAVDGVDADGLARLRGETVGFVFQAFNLLPRMTLLENVALPLLYRGVPRAARHERALAALSRVSLAHRAAHRPGEVSGGERQRAAIARALVNRPSLLLADEPTGNLDSAHGREILALLEGLRADGATLVIVTHDPGIGARASRRIAIRDGAVESDVASGPEGRAQRAAGERSSSGEGPEGRAQRAAGERSSSGEGPEGRA